MTLTRWLKPQITNPSPFRRITDIRDEVDQLFDYAFGGLLPSDELQRGDAQFLEAWGPAVDLYEDKDTITVRAELPGMKKEDIEINLHEGFLIISGERKQDQKCESAETYRSERFLGRFRRTISLSSEVDSEKITASYTDGVLSVILPKSEKAKPKQIPISVK
jgi:HSP20 family protein